MTAELALRVGRAVGSDADRVLVGRDVRDSGALLADAASAGLRECGADVVRLGVVSTPVLARHVGWLDADAAIGVTASHNPAPDNGLKLWTPSGQAFDAAAVDRVERRIADAEYDLRGYDALGTETGHDGASARQVAHLVDEFSSFADLSVVVDLGNGTGRPTVDAFVELDADVTTLNGQEDGRFPTRASEPTADSLDGLRRTVEALDADLGLAHDGDADRLMAVADDGGFVPGDVLLALFARQALLGPGGERVAVPVDTSLLVSDVVREAGGTVTYTRVGDVHVAERVAEAGYAFGGEPSGAWIWPTETLCPDAHFAALRLAELVEASGSLSGLVGELSTHEIQRENVRTANKRDVMNRVSERLTGTYDDVLTLDGVRVDADDGWFLVRASGTEPLVRITAEARDADTAGRLLAEARRVVDEVTAR
ncbi:phosphoglucosamine mutase [Salinigranum sp. GCM10025319]|uniref:phosphoglucosamine mutase n=1 Tax=Salinigranum sp. GCM10025319 TaxID=3252687 RepID=UPI00361611BF